MEQKKLLDKQVKRVAERYNLKVTSKRINHSTYALTIRSGAVDFRNLAYKQVNPYWLENDFEGLPLKVLTEFKNVLFSKDNGYFDKSDIMTDYFHCAYYVDINIGTYEKPYIYIDETDELDELTEKHIYKMLDSIAKH